MNNDGRVCCAGCRLDLHHRCWRTGTGRCARAHLLLIRVQLLNVSCPKSKACHAPMSRVKLSTGTLTILSKNVYNSIITVVVVMVIVLCARRTAGRAVLLWVSDVDAHVRAHMRCSAQCGGKANPLFDAAGNYARCSPMAPCPVGYECRPDRSRPGVGHTVCCPTAGARAHSMREHIVCRPCV
jgi:hypothetical protein